MFMVGLAGALIGDSSGYLLVVLAPIFVIIGVRVLRKYR
jgi:hypothetical protein